MAQCDSTGLLEAACSSGLACLDDGKLNVAIATIFCQILQALNPMAQCDANAILQSACNSGISCLGDRDLKVLSSQLLCDIREAIGSGSQTCLLCGTDDPSETPSCDCALYYKVLPDGNLELWYWDGAVWVQTIGGPA